MKAVHFATELSSLENMLPGLAEQGFHPELCPSLCFSARDLEAYRQRGLPGDRERLARHGLIPSWHAYFYSLDLGSVDDTVRRYSLKVLMGELESARLLGARDVVMHSGYVPVVVDFLFEYWLDVYSREFAQLADRAKELGLRLLVENVFERDLRFPAALMERFPQSHVGLCLDVGHFFVNSPLPPMEFVRALGPRIQRLHLHDNDGRTDLHLPVGRGRIPYGEFAKVLRDMNIHPEVTFENGGQIENACASRDAWFALAPGHG